jgi:hypothetical protein
MAGRISDARASPGPDRRSTGLSNSSRPIILVIVCLLRQPGGQLPHAQPVLFVQRLGHGEEPEWETELLEVEGAIGRHLDLSRARPGGWPGYPDIIQHGPGFS